MPTAEIPISSAKRAGAPVRRVARSAHREEMRVHPLLAAAAARAAALCRDALASPPDGNDVADLLTVLTGVVQSELAAVPTEIDPRVQSAVGRRLLELLRGEVVRRWPQTEAEQAAMPALLAAIERVREAIEAPWTEVASYLSGPDGLELAVNIAHDLRSPLSSILFLAEALQRGQSGPVSDLQARQLGLIYCAALGLSGVTDDIIDVARGSGHLVENEPVPFSMAAVFESVHDIVRPIAEEKRLELRLELPLTDQRYGHPIALNRVLLNLTTNALKFTDQGFVEIIARERDAARIEFSVLDSGRGIDPSVVKTLYRPLRPVAARTGHRFSPTGLGLMMCRRLVEAMGAELQVETRRGRGTRFFFELRMPTYPPGAHRGTQARAFDSSSHERDALPPAPQG